MDPNYMKIFNIITFMEKIEEHLQRYNVSHAGNCWNLKISKTFITNTIDHIKQSKKKFVEPLGKEFYFEGFHVVSLLEILCKEFNYANITETYHEPILKHLFFILKLIENMMKNPTPRTTDLPNFSKIEDDMFDL